MENYRAVLTHRCVEIISNLKIHVLQFIIGRDQFLSRFLVCLYLSLQLVTQLLYTVLFNRKDNRKLKITSK